MALRRFVASYFSALHDLSSLFFNRATFIILHLFELTEVHCRHSSRYGLVYRYTSHPGSLGASLTRSRPLCFGHFVGDEELIVVFLFHYFGIY